MAYIDFSELRALQGAENSSTELSGNNPDLMNKLNELIDNIKDKIKTVTVDETCDIIMSLQHWVSNKDRISKSDYKAGDIVLVELGNNYRMENAYAHPALVLDNIGEYILLVPTSSQESLIQKAFHPDDNVDGKKFYRRVYIRDGFDCTCVLCTTNFKTVSKGRIIKKKGDLSDRTILDEIKEQIIKFAFKKQYGKYIGLYNTVEEQRKTIAVLKNDIIEIKKRVDKSE